MWFMSVQKSEYLCPYLILVPFIELFSFLFLKVCFGGKSYSDFMGFVLFIIIP